MTAVRQAAAPAAADIAGPPALAAALATAACALGLHGGDLAMQTFMVDQVHTHGVTLVDTAWYGGLYPFAYSAAFPLIGALLGLTLSAVLASAAAAWAFDRLAVAWLGRRTPGSWYFAASTLVQVTVGELPFLTGEAAGLAALLALHRRRKGTALALGALAALCSPLAAAFLALACLAWWARSWVGTTRAVASARGVLARWSWPLVLGGVASAVVAALAVAFPGTGPFPFPFTGLVLVEGLCVAAVTPLVRTTPTVRLAVGLYALAAAVSFVVPNPVGGNAGRLASAIGVPLLACCVTARGTAAARLSLARPLAASRTLPAFERRWRPFAVVVVVPFALWQWAPGLSALRPAHDAPSSTAAFYAPLLHRLAGVAPADARVEVVPLADHWEATYVGRSDLSLARGWERQIDTARNPLFYAPGALTPDSYRAWLVGNGVTWVALPLVPDAEVDYAGRGEAALLRSAAIPGLTPTWRDARWQLWRVDASPGLLTGAAHLDGVGADQVVLDATGPGEVVVRVRPSRYWSLEPAGAGCIAVTPDGWLDLRLDAPGPVTLHASVTGDHGGACPS